MTVKQTKTAEALLAVFSRQPFANFYGVPEDETEVSNARFVKYIASYEDAPTRDEILYDIVELFGIDKNGNLRNPY